MLLPELLVIPYQFGCVNYLSYVFKKNADMTKFEYKLCLDQIESTTFFKGLINTEETHLIVIKLTLVYFAKHLYFQYSFNV